MNKYALAGIAFVAGAAAGGAGMFFYVKRYFKSMADAEIQEMADFYNRKKIYEDEKEVESNEKDISEEENKKEEKEDYGKLADLYDRKGGLDSNDNVSYGDFFSGDDNSPVDNKKSKRGRKRKVNFEIVSDDAWDNPPSGYSTRFLEYYEADGTLIDGETSEIIEEGTDILGGDVNLECGDDRVVYIQDNKNKILYHVDIEEMGYFEAGLDG